QPRACLDRHCTMKLVILLSLAAFAAAENTFSATNYYGYDFQPKHHEVYRNPEPFTRGLGPKLKTWAERFPSIKNLIESKSTALPVELQRVTNNGYTHYSQSASMQAIEGVDADSFDAFAAYLTDTLEIKNDKRDGFLASMEIIKFADNTDWSLIDIIFDQDSGSNCKYVCVLGHRDLVHNTYDFMIADFKSSFQLAPDIVLIEERKSYAWGLVQRANIRVERIPAKLKLEDVELLKTFFCQAALGRFARMLDIEVPGIEQAYIDPMTAIGLISAGLDIVPKLINIFKTTSTSTIIKEVAGEGFSRYEQTAKTSVTIGINMDNLLGTYLRVLPRLINLNADVFQNVEDAIIIGSMAESQTWNDFDIAFNADRSSTSKVQFVDVVCANRGDGKYNVIVVNVAQAFILAPNVQYIQNSKSYVGGIYSKTTIERKEYPRDLTEKDMEVLMAFFHITVFKRLAMQYGLAVPQLPDKPPLKQD
ncbi:hypothetical protein BOX15_Mlig009159g1, partial [Macrostomum lignano]